MSPNSEEPVDDRNHPDWRLAADLLRRALVNLTRGYGMTKQPSAVSALCFYKQTSAGSGWFRDWRLAALLLFQACNRVIEGFSIADGSKITGHAFENYHATVARHSQNRAAAIANDPPLR
jgi:hypothetical protein